MRPNPGGLEWAGVKPGLASNCCSVRPDTERKQARIGCPLQSAGPDNFPVTYPPELIRTRRLAGRDEGEARGWCAAAQARPGAGGAGGSEAAARLILGGDRLPSSDNLLRRLLSDPSSTGSRMKPEKELKKPRKSENIEKMMGTYLEMRTKQAEDEAAREREAREREERNKMEAREREERETEVAQSNDFSIKKCISVLNTLEGVSKLEKAKAYSVFTKSKENSETFICACAADQESALIWLRNEMS